MNRNINYILGSCLLLTCIEACTDSPKNLNESTILKTGKEIPVQPINYPHEVIMSPPNGILLVNDTTLYVFQTNRDVAALVIDATDGHPQKNWGQRGSGPEDWSYPRSWGEQNGTYYVWDQMISELRAFQAEDQDTIMNLQPVSKQRLKLSGLLISDGTVLANQKAVLCNIHDTEQPLLLTNDQLDTLISFGRPNLLPTQAHISALNGSLSSFQNTFVYALFDFGYIACYEQTGEKDVELKWEHYLDKPVLDESGQFDKALVKHGFGCTLMSKHYIFANYSGEHANRERLPYKHILMFDQEGNLLNNFSLENGVTSLTISSDEKTLYAISFQPEPTIVQIDLSTYTH